MRSLVVIPVIMFVFLVVTIGRRGGSARHFPDSAENFDPKPPIFGSFQSMLNFSALSNLCYFVYIEVS